MTRIRFAFALGLGAAVAVAAVAPAADLPPDLRKGIDDAVTAYRTGTKKADAALLAALTKEIDRTRKLPLKAEERQAVIQQLAAEKDAFERDGTIPFSPRMRAASIDYLRDVRAAGRPAELAYDKAIDFFTKGKDDASAAGLVAEKQKALAPAMVGLWHVEVTNKKQTQQWKVPLRADGTAGGKNTWSLLTDRLVIVNREAPNAPPGGWVEFCEITADGQNYTAGRTKAKLVPIPK